MRLEIILLLNVGFTPKQVSKLLGINIHTVYYNYRELNKAKKRLKELDLLFDIDE